MLHAVIIITASGLILFQKEFALLPSSAATSSSSSSLPSSSSSLSHSGASSPSYISLSSKSGQLAGIITAVINFSLSRLGGQVTYIQCDHVGVALHVHAGSKVTCAVFHQVQDGKSSAVSWPKSCCSHSLTSAPTSITSCSTAFKPLSYQTLL